MRYQRSDFFDNIEPLFGRGRPDFSNFRLGPGGRRLLILAAIALVILLVVSPAINLYTDLLWFRSLDYQSIFQTRLGYQFQIFVVAFVVALVFLAVNLLLALRLTGSSRLSAIGVRRRVLGSGVGRLTLALVALAALLMGRIGSSGWERLARALNGASFGHSDPVFGQDVSFYVFQLPAYRFAWGWILGLLVVAAGACLVIYLSRPGGVPVLGLPPGATGHLALLAAAFFLLLAVHYRLAMFGLLLSRSTGALYGAAYTDLNLRLPVYWILLVLTLALAVLSLVDVFLGRIWPLVGSLALWLVAVVFLLGLLPPIYQRFAVTPNQLNKEHDNIQRHIDATNVAYGLDRITFKDFPDSQKINPELLAANPGTVQNLRLWDYKPLQDAYQQIQAIRPFYDFADVDIDRYRLPDGYRQVMISARELSPDRLPENAKTWVNLHLKYTHGYGAAATPVNRASNEGLPDLVLKDIPPTGQLKLERPQIYFGETTKDWVIADSGEPEVDYQNGDTQTYSRWAGSHGVRLSSGWRRLLFASQLADLNLLISSQVNDNSQLLYRRSLPDRLSTLAPFLTFDSDPYAVVAGGRLVWIVDAFTTTADYPYSEPVSLSDGSELNYMRNSVKAVVDAYDGTVQFYVADDSDPIIRTYSRIFPGVFRPLSDMPAELRSHIRYPQFLFSVQAQLLQIYHMHDPQVFFGRADAWTQPNEVKTQGGTAVPLQPYYVVMKLPGEAQEEFVLIEPFSPLNKRNMVAWLAARSDGANYGKLVAFHFPSGRQVVGPEQVESNIDQDTTIAPQLTLLNQSGSRVIRGNLLVIPMGDAILFIEPVYVASTSSNAIPELKKVIVASEQKVVWADTLQQALDLLTGGAVPTTGPGPQPTPAGQTLADLIKRANALYADAQAKLKTGDFAGYANDIEQLGQVLQQIAAAQGLSPSPSPTRSP